MHSFLKSTFKFAVAIGFFVLPVNSAEAQSSFLPSGNISIGSNGPVANFNTGALGNSVLGGSGNLNVGSQGGNFSFNSNGVTGNQNFSGTFGGNQGPTSSFAPQAGGQSGFPGFPGSSSGFPGASGGSGSPGGDYRTSSGAQGVRGRNAFRTEGNWYGQTQRTTAANSRQWMRNGPNPTSTRGTAIRSVNMRPVPSASETFGFRGGFGGWAPTLLNGRMLPVTSTSSVDLNIVDY